MISQCLSFENNSATSAEMIEIIKYYCNKQWLSKMKKGSKHSPETIALLRERGLANGTGKYERAFEHRLLMAAIRYGRDYKRSSDPIRKIEYGDRVRVAKLPEKIADANRKADRRLSHVESLFSEYIEPPPEPERTEETHLYGDVYNAKIKQAIVRAREKREQEHRPRQDYSNRGAKDFWAFRKQPTQEK